MKKIGIVAPSGSVENPEKLEIAGEFLKSFGLDFKIFPSCYKTFRYMAGDDNERLKDFHDAYLDDTIDTIICARGGYGAIRILDKIDYKIIRENPKKFVGSSDITALLTSIFNKTGQITYHAKMALNGLIAMDSTEFSAYKNAIDNNVYNLPKFNNIAPNGVLWGGNLATIVSLFGSADYLPNQDIILFLEDINEPDYKIDRMLTQILRSPLKSKIKGVIWGEFIGAGRFLAEIQNEFTEALKVPFAFDDSITHGPKNAVVPVGLTV